MSALPEGVVVRRLGLARVVEETRAFLEEAPLGVGEDKTDGM